MARLMPSGPPTNQVWSGIIDDCDALPGPFHFGVKGLVFRSAGSRVSCAHHPLPQLPGCDPGKWHICDLMSVAQNDGPIGKGDYIAHVVDDQDHRSARGTAKIRLHRPDPLSRVKENGQKRFGQSCRSQKCAAIGAFCRGCKQACQRDGIAVKSTRQAEGK
jgi:hypothetical protein